MQGAQLWVKWANARGGVAGHPVNLVVYDDGGDPARHRAQVQDAVERRGVLGFLANVESLTGRSSFEYLNSKRIPVFGSDTGTSWFYESPTYFPQATSGDAAHYGVLAATASQAVPRGKHKLGTITCGEVEQCKQAGEVYAREAKPLGFDLVYRASASIAQPDFTAECLAARNAGVEVFHVLMDTNSLVRVAAACSRQGYRPLFSTAFSIVDDDLKENPNLDGMVASTNVFPWFQKGTPATDEFQKAAADYGKGLHLGVGTATGWTAGKLLERAAADLPEPPTRDALLAGAWRIQADTLGGLTQPLTFRPNQKTIPQSCWFNLAIRGGAWVSPDTYRLRCADHNVGPN